MYRQAKSVDWCQCCQQGVSLTDFQCSSDFFGNDNTPQIVYASYNPCCGARHLPASTVLLGICRPLPLAQVAPAATGGAPIAPQLLSYIYLLILQITFALFVKERRLYCRKRKTLLQNCRRVFCQILLQNSRQELKNAANAGSFRHFAVHPPQRNGTQWLPHRTTCCAGPDPHR